MGNFAVVTASAYPPITTAEAKLHLRVDETADDALIDALVLAAASLVENELWWSLMPRVCTWTCDHWPYATGIIKLPNGPVQSVTSVVYTKQDLTTGTLPAASYHVDNSKNPARLVLRDGYDWPSDTLLFSGAIVVTYLAGVHSALAEAGNVATVRAKLDPKHVAAIKLLVAHLYENREQVTVGAGYSSHELPMGVHALLAPDRAFQF